MSVDNILLLRVGIDSGTGGSHSPLFEDNTFEYISIPESSDSVEDQTYDDLLARNGGYLSKYVTHLADKIPHIDPEFDTYTYGDPGSNKRAQLSRLSSGDLLIFYSSLEPQDGDVGPRLCAIGYFTVDQSFDLQDMAPSERAEVMAELSNNAHVKRQGLTSESSLRENYPVIVKGRPEESHLFEEPRPLGDGERKVLPWVADVIGFDGDLTRAGAARVLDEDNAPEVKRWLQEGAEFLIGDDAALRSYVIVSDSGFAPNVTGGVCTLATCKPGIRNDARIGDWVLGTPSNTEVEERLVYLFRVEEALTFDEYYHDPRFEAKRPENDDRGDAIYYREEGDLVRDPATNHHTSQQLRERDLNADRVLIGEQFWYFGSEVVPIPESLRHGVIHKYKSSTRRFYSNKDRDDLVELVTWLSLRFDPGVQSEEVGQSTVNTCSQPDC